MGKALKIILCQVLSENLLAWRVLSVPLRTPFRVSKNRGGGEVGHCFRRTGFHWNDLLGVLGS